MTLKRGLLAAVALLVAAVVAAGVWGARLVKRQGLGDDEIAAYPLPGSAKIRRDARGIPTIDAGDWRSVIRAEGFAVASERLWQMDLIRRKAGGRLAEWLGETAFEHDVRKRSEGRIELAERAAAAMPETERDFCDAYAEGVNEFAGNFRGRWGLEYRILSAEPEPWRCADSLLVLLEMADVLTSTSDQEAQQEAWRKNLSETWQRFLFPQTHAWNRPLVVKDGIESPADAVGKGPRLPDAPEHLPASPLRSPKEEARVTPVFDDPTAIGSNNWAWSGPTGGYVVNDPHLSYSVPAIWYAVRLRVAADNWVVGATIPGLPGVVIGMNPFVSWAFTNTGEDVDDYLLEEVSEDGKRYVESKAGGVPTWRDVETRSIAVKVRGEASPREVTARFTSRGPLSKRRFLGDALYSRQWLGLQEGILRVPTARLARVTSLDEVDGALDGLRVPAQNVVAMDAAGNILYRTSGTGVQRRLERSGRPQPAVEGAWIGLAAAAERPRRRWLVNDGAPVRFVETANQRMWADPYDNQWYADDRGERIDRFLAARQDFQAKDMTALQLDTEGRFRKLLLDWVASHARVVEGGQAAALVARWKTWNGTSRSDSTTFSQSGLVDRELTRLLLERVQEAAKFPDVDREVPYLSWNRRAWLLELIAPSHPYAFEPMAAFGTTAADVATWLLARVEAEAGRLPPQEQLNRWDAQHPFATRIPVLGQLFDIDQLPQWGASDLVLAEQPGFGPSMRLVWSMTRPRESTWTFPVGQSGHIASAHFKDLQPTWARGETWPVFDGTDGEWAFPGRVVR